MRRLEGRVAMVTGSASGIGRATAHRLAVEEAASVAVVDLDERGAAAVADQIREAGGQAIALQADVQDEAAVAAAVQGVVDQFGPIDILHNNAALLAPDHFNQDADVIELDAAVWDTTMAVNLRGVMFGCKHALPVMIENGGGSIINTSSSSALSGESLRSAYSASKAAVIAFSRSIATMYGKRGIRCNSVVPSVILSPENREPDLPSSAVHLGGQLPHPLPRRPGGHRGGGRLLGQRRRPVHHGARADRRRRFARPQTDIRPERLGRRPVVSDATKKLQDQVAIVTGAGQGVGRRHRPLDGRRRRDGLGPRHQRRARRRGRRRDHGRRRAGDQPARRHRRRRPLGRSGGGADRRVRADQHPLQQRDGQRARDRRERPRRRDRPRGRPGTGRWPSICGHRSPPVGSSSPTWSARAEGRSSISPPSPPCTAISATCPTTSPRPVCTP